MEDMQGAIKAFRQVIGEDNVIIREDECRLASTTTFTTKSKVLAIIRPKDTHEVQSCVRISNLYKIPIYPISRGRNYGLGSRVPPHDAILLDLGRMDRIISFDETLQTITVEPGVTFAQASEYIRARSNKVYLPVIGGPPDSSLIGNALERGDAIGPYGERCLHACGLEVVLPDGECIHTGFLRFGDIEIANLSRFGVGPSLDSLFYQSSFGIVTRMTFFLPMKPKYFQVFLFTLKEKKGLKHAVDRLRTLQALGIIKPNSIAFWNAYKMVACDLQYPWDMVNGKTPLLPQDLKRMDSPWAKVEWIGIGALYSPSRGHGILEKRMVKDALKGIAHSIVFLDSLKVRIAKILKWFVEKITHLDIEEVMRNAYTESVFLGWPTIRSMKTTYWRKRMSIPKDMDLDRDKCGVLWCCPVVPYLGDRIMRAIEIAETTAFKYKFEPHIAFVTPSERVIYMFPAIVYDREIEGEDEKALACHDEMLSLMIKEGFLPYRLGIQSMHSLPKPEESYERLLRGIKSLVDPNQILSKGRYE